MPFFCLIYLVLVLGVDGYTLFHLLTCILEGNIKVICVEFYMHTSNTLYFSLAL